MAMSDQEIQTGLAEIIDEVAGVPADQVTPDKIERIRRLNELAIKRDQTLAQMALAWILKNKKITSVLIGVSKPEQVTDSLQCFRNTWFSEEELRQIEEILR